MGLTYQPPDEFRPLFAALRGVRGSSPGRWQACCPLHNTKDKSLSLVLSDGGDLLLRCHGAGRCGTAEILRHLGFCFRDLYSERNRIMSRPDSKFVCAYQYRDAKGVMLYETLRFDPKSFSVRRPHPDFKEHLKPSEANPKWIYNVTGVPLTLYYLPELLAALKEKPDRWVMVLEGEEDVKCAWRYGMVATTNAFGAGKWRPEYSQMLKGCNVVVIPDEDKPGLEHAHAVCQSLLGVAGTVRLCRLRGVERKGDDFREFWRRQDVSETPLQTRKQSLASLFRETPTFTRDTPPPQMLVFDTDHLTPSPQLPVQPEPTPEAEVEVKVRSVTPQSTKDEAYQVTPQAAVPGETSAEVSAADIEKMLAQAAGTDAVGVRAIINVLGMAGTLKRHTHPLKNSAEWFGGLWLDLENLKNTVVPERYVPESKVDYKPIRAAAIQACASILRGLLELEKLRKAEVT